MKDQRKMGERSGTVSVAWVQEPQRQSEDGIEDGVEDFPGNQQADHAKCANLKSQLLKSLGGLFGKKNSDGFETVEGWERQEIEDTEEQVQGKHHAQEGGGTLHRACSEAEDDMGEVG